MLFKCISILALCTISNAFEFEGCPSIVQTRDLATVQSLIGNSLYWSGTANRVYVEGIARYRHKKSLYEVFDGRTRGQIVDQCEREGTDPWLLMSIAMATLTTEGDVWD
jgi:hypothetical protein